MSLFSAFAVYFVIWWVTLFAVLPFGLRTQDEEGNVVPGTTASAPHRFRPWRVILWTSLVAALVFAAWYGVVIVLGYGLEDLSALFWTS
ncbi:DUF1467 family protein [Martelella lutilitoris]|uniref:DUF1467 family protein n=1 Tax=Martelella lutilitoris TaxID=2583532 RepID=A0A7T7HMQ5_9HYPH|nr:DUF1467 family protein [Martelella lutilitoris]QQM32017.1 DUF1467 family protein [Martelella lutilitoris]